jgi:hypothetical protein
MKMGVIMIKLIKEQWRKCFFLLLMVSLPGVSDMLPFVTGVRLEKKSADQGTYFLDWELHEAGPEFSGRNGLTTYYKFGIAHLHDGTEDKIGHDFIDIRYRASVGEKDTWGDIATKLLQGRRSPAEIEHAGMPFDEISECVGFVYQASTNELHNMNHYIGGVCNAAPPADEWCEITTPTVTLDHGMLVMGYGTPTEVVERASVMCTAPMTLKIKFGTDVLELGTGVKATLDVPGGSDLEAPAGDSTFQIRSKLTVLPDSTPGEYSGQTIVTLQYQ